jgi:hypothetical protein
MYDTVEKFREYLKDTSYVMNGVQHKYAFPNNYGASVVKHDGSYGGQNGLWELAVLDYSIDSTGELCYTSGITDDVIGHLTWKNVEEFLSEIKQL